MRAALFNGPHSINVGARPDPTIKEPTDAIVRVALTPIPEIRSANAARGESPHDQGAIGHEFNPGRVFDFETDLDHITEAYSAMDERRAIKSLLRMSPPPE